MFGNFWEMDGGQRRTNASASDQSLDIIFANKESDAVLYEVQNMRKVVEGIQEGFKIRGGSALAYSIPTNHEIIHADYVRSTSVDYPNGFVMIQAKYAGLQGDVGKIGIYNGITVEWIDTSKIASSINLARRFKAFSRGPKVYLFDMNTPFYFDVNEKVAYKWHNADVGKINEHNFMSGGYATENVFGFEVGAEIVVWPSREYLNEEGETSIEAYRTQVEGATEFGIQYRNPEGLLEYSSIESNKDVVLPFSADISGSYSQDAVSDGLVTQIEPAVLSLESNHMLDSMLINLAISFDGITKRDIRVSYGETTNEILTKIKTSLEGVESIIKRFTLYIDANKLKVRPRAISDSYDGLKINVEIIPVRGAENIPDGSIPYATLRFVSSGIRIIKTASEEVVDNDVTIYRAYKVAYLYNDGSLSLCGPSYEISLKAKDILEANHRAVEIQFPEIQQPSHIRERYVFSTRWQKSLENCYKINSDYPNGRFFFNGSVNSSSTRFEDVKSDSELLNAEASYLELNNGVSALIGGGRIKPTGIEPFRDSAVIAGYELNYPNPSPADNSYSYVGEGSVQKSFLIGLQYLYRDGSKSPVLSDYISSGSLATLNYRTRNRFRFYRLNSMVEAVLIVCYKSGVDTKLIKRIDRNDIGFYGAEVVFEGDPETYESIDTESGNLSYTSIKSNSVIVLDYMQQLSLTQQKEIPILDKIIRAPILDIDSDKASSVRYRMVALGDKNPVLCYLSRSVVDGSVLLELDYEPCDSAIGCVNADSVFISDGMVLYEGENGLYGVQGTKVQQLIDRKRYVSFASSKIIGHSIHPTEDELWLFFEGNEAMVFNQAKNYTWIAKYGFDVANICSFNGKLYCNNNSQLIELDSKAHSDDLGVAITGQIISNELVDMFSQVHLRNVNAIGKDLNVSLQVDLKKQRYKKSGVVSRTGFIPDINISAKAVSENGATYRVNQRGMGPQFLLNVTGEGLLYGVQLHYREIKNNGVNRN